MDNKKCKSNIREALTMLEMVIALAIMAVVFAVLLPQFRTIQNSWASKAGNAETLQNGRVLIEHLNYNLSRAAIVTAVSDATEAGGYIEFMDADDITMRYDIGPSQYVRFGPVGNLSDLAGPVSELRFTCYDAFDLDTPITDPKITRFVKIETQLPNSSPFSDDKYFTAKVYIQPNNYGTEPVGTTKEIDATLSQVPALSRIDMTHYLCAYTGPGDDGWVAVLTVNTGDWTVVKEAPLEFDTAYGVAPDVGWLDARHHLCVYQGPSGPGIAVILEVDTASWTVSKKTPVVFDAVLGKTPVLVQIDSTHFLCAYTGPDNDGWAVVLTVNTSDWSVSAGTAFEFDTIIATDPALSQIDSGHYLCAYEGEQNDGYAVVLTVNTSDWTISKETTFEFDTIMGRYPALAQIDTTHYLCAYTSLTDDAKAIILSVNTVSWTISKGMTFLYDSVGGALPTLAKLDSVHYFCVYTGKNDDGWMVTLRVYMADWTLSAGIPFEY